MLNDPIVDEVRKNRHTLEKKLGNDSAKILAYFKKIQEKYKNRLHTGKPKYIHASKVA
jgi:hypothetical protein